jgi:predicted NodU family carbamoyl transferase
LKGTKRLIWLLQPNLRVKFREPFRPYAPMTPNTEVTLYFDCTEFDMSFMSFSPTVRPQWRGRLAGTTHFDGTARVQTLTNAQNPWMFRLLTSFGNLTGVPVLLNTSFNIKGRPILNRISDALSILRTTDVDYAVVEDWLFDKAGVGTIG